MRTSKLLLTIIFFISISINLSCKKDDKTFTEETNTLTLTQNEEKFFNTIERMVRLQ